jgi:hypothetical protein
MKIRLIAATAFLTVSAAALVQAQPYGDQQPRAGAPRLADAAPADARDDRYAAPPAGAAGAGPSVRNEGPAPAYRPRPAARPFAEAGPRPADMPPPAARREPALDTADAPPPEARPYAAPRRAAGYDRPAYDRPAYDRHEAYDEAPPRDRRTDYRSARFGDGGGSTWRTGRDTHAFAATIGGCRISGFAGPGGYKLGRSC